MTHDPNTVPALPGRPIHVGQRGIESPAVGGVPDVPDQGRGDDRGSVVRWDFACEHQLASAADVHAFMVGCVEMLTPRGNRRIALWFGSHWNATRREAQLRIDLDPGQGAAAVRWLDDDTVGSDGHQGDGFLTWETQDRPAVPIPAGLVLCRIESAIAAAAEYTANLGRPACLTWAPLPA